MYADYNGYAAIQVGSTLESLVKVYGRIDHVGAIQKNTYADYNGYAAMQVGRILAICCLEISLTGGLITHIHVGALKKTPHMLTHRRICCNTIERIPNYTLSSKYSAPLKASQGDILRVPAHV